MPALVIGMNDPTKQVSKDWLNEVARGFVGIFNVLDYGAHADGATDDAAHIQSAIDAAEAAGGGIVFLPYGDYLISSKLFVTGNHITIHGAGYGTRVIASATTNSLKYGMLSFNANGLSSGIDVLGTTRMHDIVLRDLYFDHSAVPQSTDVSDGGAKGALFFWGIDHLLVENVTLYDGFCSGFTFTGCWDAAVNNCVVRGLHTYVYGAGVASGGNCFNFTVKAHNASAFSQPQGAYRVSNCYADGTADSSWPYATSSSGCAEGQIGFYINMGSYTAGTHESCVSLTNCFAERCRYGIAPEAENVGGTGDCIISNNTVRQCEWGIYMVHDSLSTPNVQGVYETVISNNRVYDCLFDGINAVGERLSITGNVVTNWAMGLDSMDAVISSRTDVAYAIKVTPCHVSNTSATVANGVLVANNVCRMLAAHDTTYCHPLSGIGIISSVDHLTFKNVAVEGNVLDGGQVTFGSNGTGGIWLKGNIDGAIVADNIVTGFGGQGIACLGMAWNDPANAPTHVDIRGNTVYDNGWASDTPEIWVQSSNGFYNIENNKMWTTAVTPYNTFAIRWTGANDANLDVDYITVRGNRATGYAAASDAICIQSTGDVGIIIEDNEALNRRTAHPTANNRTYWPVAAKVWNTAPATGTLADAYCMGWVCTTAGQPGTWSPFGAIAAS